MKNLQLYFSSVLAWFDTYRLPLTKDEKCQNKESIDWLRGLPLITIHLLALSVFWIPFSWELLIICLLSYLVRMFAITAFYHRYFSHRTYKTSRICQFLFACLGASAVQRGPIWWASHHRTHHKLSDKPGDEHSPQIHPFITSHFTWFLKRKNLSYESTNVKDLLKYKELRFLDRFDTFIPVLYASSFIGLGSILNGLAYSCTGFSMFIWGFCVSTVLLYHMTFSINSLAHIFGKRSYPTMDNSRNHWLLAILTLGEGWHNNHHFWPSSVRQGFKWYELDISYLLLKLMSFLNLIYDLRELPKDVKKAKISRR